MDDRNELLALHLDGAHPRTSQNDAPGAPELTSLDENSQIPNGSSKKSLSILKRHVRALAVPERESKGRKFHCHRTLPPLIDLRHDSSVESDGSDTETGLFSMQYTLNPLRTKRKRNLAASPQRPLPKGQCQHSPDSSPESVTKLSLKKVFERRKKRSKLRAKACAAKEICSKPQNQLQQFCKYIPATRHHRRWKDQAGQFPILDQKDLTLKMIFTYEQASLWGFLHHMKKLKYDRHLQESLQSLNVSDVSDGGHLAGRRYHYLDDDGPISPIPDAATCNATEPSEEYDAKVVDNGCFILNWKPSTKKKLSKKKKKLKRGKLLQRDQKDDVAKGDGYHKGLGKPTAEN